MIRAAGAWGAVVAVLAGPAGAQVFPGASWQTATPEALGLDPAPLNQAESYALSAGGAGMIVRSGFVVESWGNVHESFELKSATKSLGSMLLGLAIGDGLLALGDAADDHLATVGVPPQSNAATGWVPGITIRSLATHTGGFPHDGGYGAFIYQPGTAWDYSNCGANWLGDVLTVVLGDDLDEVFEHRVREVIGIPDTEFYWRPNALRDATIAGIPRREIASGVSTSVDALARIGYLCLRQGTWAGTPVLPAGYAVQMGQVDPSLASLPNRRPGTYPGATSHYGLLWWTNADGTLAAPTDTYFAWGLYEALIVVIPSLDIVAARLGGGWQDPFTGNYAIISPFIEPIAASAAHPVSAPELESVSWGRLRAGFRGAP